MRLGNTKVSGFTAHANDVNVINSNDLATFALEQSHTGAAFRPVLTRMAA